MTIFHLLVFLGFFHWSESVDSVIHTPSGSIKGIVNQYGNENVYEFRNIPYAKPPIGDLRFRKPQPYGTWSGVRDGAYFGPSCMQDMSFSDMFSLDNRNISEDCLSLNIYVPYQILEAGQHNRSVMIWVHGGGYIIGQAELYDASPLALRGDVVVVTINYRLGLFGFLSTEDKASRGNFGLWDQHLAFKWAKDNIASFGGNPNSITIFGESAGGWSVSLQSLAIQNKGLFQRVIAQSGVTNSQAAVTNEGLYFAKQYGVLLGCINSTFSFVDTTKLVSCMRQKSSDELLSAQLSDTLLRHDIYRLDTVPVVDGEFVVDLPENILQNGNSESFRMFQSVDFISGNCNMEGSLLYELLVNESIKSHFDLSIGVPTSVLCNYFGPGLVEYLFPDSMANKYVSNAVCNKYRSTDPGVQGRNILDLYGDAEFVVPAVKSLNAHSKNNNLTKSYQYMFNRPSIFSPNQSQWFNGSAHGSELPYLFYFNISIPQNEQMLSEAMLGYWTNFAKTG